MDFIVHYIILAVIFVVIDALWIGIVANKFYKKEIGALLLAKPRLGIAALFYALYIWGLLFLLVDPALEMGQTAGELVTRAAVLGGIMYATYDLTNLSTLKGWSAKISAVDMVWGAVLTSLVSLCGFMLFK